MSRSGFIPTMNDTVIGEEDSGFAVSISTGLGNWEETDPCRYANQSCKGKMFGKLKSCRRQREKSQALCKAHEASLQKKAQWEGQRQEMMQALQTNITTTAQHQKTANSTMKSGIAVGGVALTGAIAVTFLLIKRRKKSSK
ncbi:MAG TPA: hypothetical protein DD671_14805 [Balneolaceae bacterium]|nr:hypothetical protein [Balneola sp.]HBQ60844.1 hypothetical protein [Balneolaceae bacterium]